MDVLNVFSNRAWSVIESLIPSWLHLDKLSGDGDDVINVTVDKNSSTDSRTATVTVVTAVGNASASSIITQEGATPDYIFNIDGDSYIDVSPTPSGQSMTFNIVSTKDGINQVYEPTGDLPDWITVDQYGYGQGGLQITFNENATGASRQANIAFKQCESEYIIDMYVQQEDAQYIFTINSVTYETAVVDADSKTLQFDVVSTNNGVNQPYACISSSADCDWMEVVSLGYGTNGLSINIKANTSNGSRLATLMFSQDISDKTFAIEIYQEMEPMYVNLVNDSYTDFEVLILPKGSTTDWGNIIFTVSAQSSIVCRTDSYGNELELNGSYDVCWRANSESIPYALTFSNVQCGEDLVIF